MKRKPDNHSITLTLCFTAAITLAASPPVAGDTPVRIEAVSSPTDKNQADKQYRTLMAELAATPEDARRDIPPQHMELASREITLRKDGDNAMMLGWIHFQRKEYEAAERLFTQAGQWGETEKSREARSLVSLRLAHQAVDANDHAAALRHAEQATKLGSVDSYNSTGWMLFRKQAYDDAFTAFSQAPPSAEKEQALDETCFQQSLQALAAGNDERAEQAARCSQKHGRDEVMTTLGWTLYKEDNYSRANRFFSAQQPQSEQSLYGSALSLKAGGDSQSSRELACGNSQRSQRIQTLCVDLLTSRMLADYQAGKHKAVLTGASELERFGALHPDLHALLAWSELAEGQYDTAAKRFDKLLTQQPDQTSHAHGLLKSLSHNDNAMTLADARTRHPLVDIILSQQTPAPETPPPQPGTPGEPVKPQEGSSTSAIDANKLSRAIELYHAKDYKRSHELLQELHPGIIENKDSGLLTLAGWAAFHVGNFSQARDDFLTAAKWTKDSKIWLMVVEAEIALQNPERGREIVDTLPPSRERDKMLTRLIALQAAAAYNDKEYAKAEALLSTPDFALNDDDLELLGWSRYQQGKYEAAIPSFEAAYRGKPSLARAKGLVFSHIHLRQPGKLIALADELQGPIVELTSDEEVREKLREGQEDWISVSSEGVLVVQEPPKKISPITRALRKLEGLPGSTWGSVDHDFVDNDTHVSFLINQGIDWLVLPGDITLNTFVEYRSMHNAWQSVYDDDEFGFGLELKRTPFNLGIEHLPAEWSGNDQEQNITTAYLGWYHSWYKYLRRRGSTISNPFDVNAYAGSTYGRISHQLNDSVGTTARGFVRQGMDWFTSITNAGEITLNTYAAYRFRFRTEDNYWYDAHGPAVGIELQRNPFSLGVDYMWQVNPQRDTSEAVYGLYLTWYYDWNLKPE